MAEDRRDMTRSYETLKDLTRSYEIFQDLRGSYLDLEALLLKASLCEEAEDRRDREAVRYLLFEAGAQGRLDCLGRPINFEREGQRELTTAPAVGAL